MAETFSRSLTCNLECQEATSVKVIPIFNKAMAGHFLYRDGKGETSFNSVGGVFPPYKGVLNTANFMSNYQDIN